ncbi:polyisoprenoid-binding protein [Aureimonas endophytica]|uniref:Polyisoprenoid-binding protein n=1 Tax=Aureimonas endophytica TaxID=2027858 RepID=A0A916ZH51_9HYPH|nr:YceI family protein [Aureimonas endophytica]GGD97669.1 polyisoprenoid-binding protein [Aureimonas endophytica]
MSPLKSLVIAGSMLLGLSAASAQTVGVPSGTYVADPLHTNVLWTVSHFGTSNYIGRFSKIAATLELDAKEPAKSKLTATIDPASVDTNYPAKDKDFNKEIESNMFIDAATFDTIKFVSTKIETTGNDTGKITGDLTFHGVTKPVVLDVKMNAALNPHPMSKKPVVGFSATGSFKRSDFGVAALVGPVGDEVKLTIETEFSPK